MSKAISFGFGKSKATTAAPAKTSLQLPTAKKPRGNFLRTHDSDNEDEAEPQHESVAGFSSDGVILSKPVQPEEVKIIQNSGNGDWRNRGRGTNLLPAEVQAARNGNVALVEKDEVSTLSGLQFAGYKNGSTEQAEVATTEPKAAEPSKPLTEDEMAMAALLGDGPKSNAVIMANGNARLSGQDETADFRQDVASRPDACTLEEYAAMPVEEFGMAMLRGMGQKRKAAGQVINLEGDKTAKPQKIRKQNGLLGIGAKDVPGADIELGAWGKADMRKNDRGQNMFTPLMRENKATGERITEEEFQRRMKELKSAPKDDEWKERRDRNLQKSGGGRHDSKRNGDQKAITNGDENGSSRHSSSSRRERDDRDYDKSKSRRDRSRSKDRSHRRDRDDEDDDDYDSRRRDKHRDRLRDDDRYDSSSSHRSRHRDRSPDRNRDRDRDYKKDRDRDRDRDRGNERRYRDRK